MSKKAKKKVKAKVNPSIVEVRWFNNLSRIDRIEQVNKCFLPLTLDGKIEYVAALKGDLWDVKLVIDGEITRNVWIHEGTLYATKERCLQRTGVEPEEFIYPMTIEELRDKVYSCIGDTEYFIKTRYTKDIGHPNELRIYKISNVDVETGNAKCVAVACSGYHTNIPEDIIKAVDTHFDMVQAYYKSQGVSFTADIVPNREMLDDIEIKEPEEGSGSGKEREEKPAELRKKRTNRPADGWHDVVGIVTKMSEEGRRLVQQSEVAEEIKRNKPHLDIEDIAKWISIDLANAYVGKLVARSLTRNSINANSNCSHSYGSAAVFPELATGVLVKESDVIAEVLKNNMIEGIAYNMDTIVEWDTMKELMRNRTEQYVRNKIRGVLDNLEWIEKGKHRTWKKIGNKAEECSDNATVSQLIPKASDRTRRYDVIIEGVLVDSIFCLPETAKLLENNLSKKCSVVESVDATKAIIL